MKYWCIIPRIFNYDQYQKFYLRRVLTQNISNQLSSNFSMQMFHYATFELCKNIKNKQKSTMIDLTKCDYATGPTQENPAGLLSC